MNTEIIRYETKISGNNEYFKPYVSRNALISYSIHGGLTRSVLKQFLSSLMFQFRVLATGDGYVNSGRRA